MVSTSFWSADGKPMSAAQFLESLFGALPSLFKDEGELRKIWSLPNTRRALLDELGEKGFSRDHLHEMQKIVSAEKSDIFDVLAFVAYASPLVTREVRAAQAKTQVQGALNSRQKSFIEFVLDQYVKQGVEELDLEKLSPLLKLKYSAIADATAQLGEPVQIKKLFIEFQRFLYEDRKVA